MVRGSSWISTMKPSERRTKPCAEPACPPANMIGCTRILRTSPSREHGGCASVSSAASACNSTIKIFQVTGTPRFDTMCSSKKPPGGRFGERIACMNPRDLLLRLECRSRRRDLTTRTDCSAARRAGRNRDRRREGFPQARHGLDLWSVAQRRAALLLRSGGQNAPLGLDPRLSHRLREYSIPGYFFPPARGTNAAACRPMRRTAFCATDVAPWVRQTRYTRLQMLSTAKTPSNSTRTPFLGPSHQ